jgi:hypothetical protein
MSEDDDWESRPLNSAEIDRLKARASRLRSPPQLPDDHFASGLTLVYEQPGATGSIPAAEAVSVPRVPWVSLKQGISGSILSPPTIPRGCARDEIASCSITTTGSAR